MPCATVTQPLRAVMRTHLWAVLDSLLLATEEKAEEQARRVINAKRVRYDHIQPEPRRLRKRRPTFLAWL